MNANARTLYELGLENLSTIDGREILFVEKLRAYLSESALYRYRVRVEIMNLLAFSRSGLSGFPVLTEQEEKALRAILSSSRSDASIMAEYDHFGRNGVGPMEQDMKATEFYLREVFDEGLLGRLKEFIHFPATSEDINNLAWNMMLRDAVNDVWLPLVIEVCDFLGEVSVGYADVPVLGITHGRKASPTTFGKRFGYFLARFSNVLRRLQTMELSAKFSGPVGNDNAMTAIAPEFDMEGHARSFVNGFGFRYEPIENQRNSHVEIVRLLNEVNLVNMFAMDLCEHVRHNIMMGWLDQEGTASGVGSSVMPHKINPWYFEVAEGYAEQAVALIQAAQVHLIDSVFERDLTDHPWERAYGEMLGKSVIALSYIAEGVRTLRVNDEKALAELKTTPEVLTEAVQMMGRLRGVPNIYMTIKELSRGRLLTFALLHEIIDENIPDADAAKLLKSLTPESYVGVAPKLAMDAAAEYAKLKPTLKNGLLHPMAGVSAVLFDFDNTLQMGDKLELGARLAAIAKELGMDFSNADIARFGDRSDYREMRAMMIAEHNGKGGTRVTEEAFNEANKGISGTLDSYFYLAPGAMDLLSHLKGRGYALGLVTTRGSNSLSRLLSMHGIGGFFDAVVNRDDAKERKPHPESIMKALKELGVSPGNAAFIGDKQVDDVVSSRSVGMKAILVSSDPLDELCALPSVHAKSLTEIIPLFP